MKKVIAIVLTALICLSLAACGGASGANGNNDGEAKQDIYIEKSEDGITYMVFPDSKTFDKYIVKIEITKDNWQEYFEDYEYTEHIVKTNAFGDIEEEYDAVSIGFGLKRNILGLADEVSFKFDGMTEYSDYNFDKADADKVEYEVYTANQSTYGIYSYTTDELIEEAQLNEDEVKAYYLLEVKYDRGEDELHFGNHNCIDATGVIYILDLPEGIYNGENVTQIKYASGGGAGFGVGVLEMHYAD